VACVWLPCGVHLAHPVTSNQNCVDGASLFLWLGVLPIVGMCALSIAWMCADSHYCAMVTLLTLIHHSY
jgi:hypothetical protein